jgi:SP family sugar:H+ symporter-like MFS transporter
MFPLQIRSKALSMTTASNWFWNFVLGFVTPYMVNSGPGDAGLGSKVFFIWAAFCALAVVFVWAFIYETKGLSLEQVDELFTRCKSARQSPAFRKSGALDLVAHTTGSDIEKSGHVSVAEST